jgi:hypothetical protein
MGHYLEYKVFDIELFCYLMLLLLPLCFFTTKAVLNIEFKIRSYEIFHLPYLVKIL